MMCGQENPSPTTLVSLVAKTQPIDDLDHLMGVLSKVSSHNHKTITKT